MEASVSSVDTVLDLNSSPTLFSEKFEVGEISAADYDDLRIWMFIILTWVRSSSPSPSSSSRS